MTAKPNRKTSKKEKRHGDQKLAGSVKTAKNQRKRVRYHRVLAKKKVSDLG